MTNIQDKISEPIKVEMEQFNNVFADMMRGNDGLLQEVLSYVSKRSGKRMRPMLLLLMTKALDMKNTYNETSCVPYNAYRAAIALELLHTASLVHDDVVDESDERRGQKSVNSAFTNKLAVLGGDYLLSVALTEIAKTGDIRMVETLSELGKTLAEGEIHQLENIATDDLSEKKYFDIITKKTASLFEACCVLAAYASEATEEQRQKAARFGRNVGLIFQIKDDIFDYFDKKEIGKPTGNDMLEGKLTLPVLRALLMHGNSDVLALALKVRKQQASAEEIAQLRAFAVENGGIEAAENEIKQIYDDCRNYLSNEVENAEVRTALREYLNYLVVREK